MSSDREPTPGKFATVLGAGLCFTMLVLGLGLSGCGGSTEEGNSSGGAGSIDLTKKDEASTDAPKKSAAGLRGQGLGNDAPSAKRRGR